MFCMHCGKQINDNAAFCPWCGMGIEKEEPQTRYCQNCGALMKAEDRFCKNCGASVNDTFAVMDEEDAAELHRSEEDGNLRYESPEEDGSSRFENTEEDESSWYGGGYSDPDDKKPKKSRKPIIFLVVALAALLAAGGFFAVRYFGNKSGDEPQKAAEAQIEEEDQAEPSSSVERTYKPWEVNTEEIEEEMTMASAEEPLETCSVEECQPVDGSESAKEALTELQDDLGFSSLEEFSEPVYQGTDSQGAWFFYQNADGIPVDTDPVRIITGYDGSVLYTVGEYIPKENINTSTEITEEEAAGKLSEVTGKGQSVLSLGEVIYVSGEKGEAAWKFFVSSEDDDLVYYVSAVSGEILDQKSTRLEEEATGHGATTDKNETDDGFSTNHVGEKYLLENLNYKFRVYDLDNKKASSLIVLRTDMEAADYYIENTDTTAPGEDDDYLKNSTADPEHNYRLDILGDNLRIRDDAAGWVVDEQLVAEMRFRNSADSKTFSVVEDKDNTWKNKEAVSVYKRIQDSAQYYSTEFEMSNGHNKWGDILSVGAKTKLDGGAVGLTNTCPLASPIGQRSFACIYIDKDHVNDLDTVAHEYTHAVQQCIATVSGQGETGALLEAVADIMGECVEADATGTCDWIHNNRNLSDPAATGHPAVYSAYDESKGPHSNSTIISHIAYRMATGNVTHTNGTKALTVENTGKLVFNTFSSLSSYTDYPTYCRVLYTQAVNLYRAGTLDRDQVRCVYQAIRDSGISLTFGVSKAENIVFTDLDGNVLANYAIDINNGAYSEEVKEDPEFKISWPTAITVRIPQNDGSTLSHDEWRVHLENTTAEDQTFGITVTKSAFMSVIPAPFDPDPPLVSVDVTNQLDETVPNAVVKYSPDGNFAEGNDAVKEAELNPKIKGRTVYRCRLKPGSYSGMITTLDDSHLPKAFSVTVDENGPKEINLAEEIEKYGTLEGTVVDKETGEKLSGAAIVCDGGEPRVYNLPSVGSSFKIEKLPPAQYTLTFTLDGYLSNTVTAEVNGDKKTLAPVEMEKTGNFTGSAYTPGRMLVRDTRLLFFDENWDQVYSFNQKDADEFSVTVDPGTYFVRIINDDIGEHIGKYTIPEKEIVKTEVTLRSRPGALYEFGVSQTTEEGEWYETVAGTLEADISGLGATLEFAYEMFVENFDPADPLGYYASGSGDMSEWGVGIDYEMVYENRNTNYTVYALGVPMEMSSQNQTPLFDFDQLTESMLQKAEMDDDYTFFIELTAEEIQSLSLNCLGMVQDIHTLGFQAGEMMVSLNKDLTIHSIMVYAGVAVEENGLEVAADLYVDYIFTDVPFEDTEEGREYLD